MARRKKRALGVLIHRNVERGSKFSSHKVTIQVQVGRAETKGYAARACVNSPGRMVKRCATSGIDGVPPAPTPTTAVKRALRNLLKREWTK